MLKILIADDEPKIRKGLYNILLKSPLELTLLEPVKNGELAYELAIKEQPDVMLIDICMPKKDGLTLTHDLKQALPDSHVIIISGHDEFDYAQRAIALKVYDYLLKPIAPDKLIDVIEQLARERKVRQTKKLYSEWVQSEVNRRISDISATLFENWVAGTMTVEKLKASLNHLNLPIEQDMLLLNIHILPSLTLSGSDWDRDTLFFAVANITDETCRNMGLTPVLFLGTDDNIVLLVSPVYLSWQNALIKNIEQNLHIYLKRKTFINSKLVQNVLENLPESYALLTGEQRMVRQYNAIAKEAKIYIDAHYADESLSLQQVADEMDVTHAYLSRLLKKELTMSFTEYLSERRLKKAVELLNAAGNDLKIGAIASAVGYTSQHYFSKVFKKRYGVSPSNYNRKAQNDHE